MREELLFNEHRLLDALFAWPDLLAREIGSVDRNTILNTSLSDLADHFVSRFTSDIPRLQTGRAHQLDPEDVSIDVSHDISRVFHDDGPHHLQGTQYTLIVPFEGDPDFFGFQPSRYYSSGVRGEVTDQTLVFRHRQLDPDGAAIRRDFEERIAQVEEYLETQRRDTQEWNDKLPQRVRDLLEARKKKALEAMKLAGSLDFPLKQREGAAYAVPVERKRVVVDMPTPKSRSYAPEPELRPEVYEEILRVIRSLSITMERSPSAFATMGEEHLRDHILVSLNGQFEGAATGETFNRSGKTDILIREKDRNVFIAECKFWDGPKSLIAAIDQILSYLSWRDTKVALIVFNRRKDISAVLAAIPETVAQHPLFKKQLDYKSEGAFRFLFGQKDDRNRELILTVMVFDVPGTPTEETAPLERPAVPSAPASGPSARPAPRRKR